MCLFWTIQSLDQMVNSVLSKLAQPFDSFFIDPFEQDSRPRKHFQECCDNMWIAKASHDRDHLRCKLRMDMGIFNQPLKKRNQGANSSPFCSCRDDPVLSQFV